MRTLTATLLLLSATWVVAQVTTNANGGPGSLRAAIAAANSGDTITFDASLSGTTITLTSGALITTLANLTIDASTLTNPVTVDANNASQVFFHSGGGTFAINNLEVTGGSVDGGLLSTGGGIRSRGTAVIVTNSTISGNFARDSGGGISSNGDVTLTNSTISGNSAGFIGGGGIFSVGTVTVTNSIVSGNSTNNGDGGGIFSDSGAVTVTNSTISGNNANNGGGGIFSLLAATITNSTISGNSAGAGGGIHGRSNVMVTNSAISGNSATGNGGGIFDLGSTTITNSTISGNSAGSLGGGIATSFNVTLRNSLVLGNDAPNSPQIRTLFSINNNNSAYALTDFSAVTTLADVFTAPEPTASAPTNAGDYTLAACSPAINAGNNAAAPAGNDLAGNARIQNVTVDMGAFESASGTCQTITFDLSTLPVKTVGDADFDISSFASASSGLDVTFSSTTPTVCTTGGTNGATITLVVNGTCTINADQVGNAEYEPAAQVQDSFTVNAAATTIVNKTADTNDGSCDTADCSLREALVNANDGDTITFDASLSGATITLALGQLGTSRNNVTIDASALTNPVTIDANNASRVFIFSDVGTFEINNLVVTNGNANSGGGIYTLGNIIVTNSSITGNLVSNTGGGIFSEGTTTVINSTISGNSAGIQGGGILSVRNFNVTNSSITGNSAGTIGGGIRGVRNVTVTNSTISGNTVDNGDGGGIYSTRAVTLTNSLVLGNAALTDPQIFASNGITLNTSAYGFNTGESTDDAFVGSNLNVVFVNPDTNPATNAPNDGAAYDYTLVACSPAINAGTNASAPAGNDLAGNARIQNVTVDMGAFESNLRACQTIDFDLSTLPATTYGDADVDISAFANASSGLAVTFTSATPAVCTVTGSTVSIVAAGTCTINADQAGNAEYNAAAQVQQDITIAQQALDATVDNQNRDYGVANPALTLTYTGFVPGDTAADIDVAPTLATTAVATSNVGTYPITCDTAPFADTNYTLNTCTAGTLTVNQAAVTVTADDIVITEGGTPTFTATYAGFVGADDESVLTTAVSFADDAPDYNTAGIYTITPSGAAAANYTFTYTTGTLTIQTAGFSITESGGDTAVTEGGATDTIDVVLTSIPTADVDITVTPDAQLNVGAGAGTAETLTFTPANWDTPQPINVTANDDTDVEGAHTGTLSFTVASGDGNYDAAVLADITVAITDDEPAVIITPTTLATTEGAAAVTYDVSFNTNPISPVTITLTPDAQTDLGAGAGTAIDLTFNDTTPQTVSVTAVDDVNVEGNHTSTITHAITTGDGGDYPDTFVIADITVDITDNDVANLGSGGDIQIRNGATTAADSITSNGLVPLSYGIFKRNQMVVLEYLVRNPSDTTLELGELVLPPFMSVVGQALPASLASFESALMEVAVDTSTAGVLEGQVSLANNDPDANENPFVFDVIVTISDEPANALYVLPGIALEDVQAAAGQTDVPLLSFYVEVAAGSVPVTIDSFTLEASSNAVRRAKNLRLYIDGGTRGQLDNRDVFLASTDATQALTFTFDARTFQPGLPMWFIVVADF